MKLTCPHCNQALSLETLSEDASARQLFALLPQFGPASGLVVAYLALFRPRVQALRWSRALALTNSLRDLRDEHQLSDRQLAWCIDRALASLHDKRQQAGDSWKPLTSHGYLKKIMQSAPPDGGQIVRTTDAGTQTMQQPSWQQQGADNLDQLRNLK